jgi:dienelactone hydrolase
MSLRRIAPLLLALVASCARSVGHEATPESVDSSVFDPANGAVPLPNDLALTTAPTLPDGAQKDLLLAFAAQGGFPNDIEVPITIDFTRTAVGSGATSAPTLDLSTVTPATVVLLKLGALGAAPAAYDTSPGAVTQTQSGSRTTLHLRAPKAADGSRNWEPGAHYAVAVRGGPNGVKTADAQQIHASPTMYLLLAGKNLADPANQALLPDPSLGPVLEALRQSYLPVFMVVDAVFPSRELANLQTFQIAPSAGTGIRVDQTAGVVPLPFDLLRSDPDGTIIDNPGFGPAAAGLDTLDGFSTTAMMLAPTSGPIDAGTVAGNVFVFKLGAGAPSLVLDVLSALVAGHPEQAGYVAEPPQITQACASATGSCANLIGLQPAVGAPTGTPAGTLFLPPLAESTEYAVVVTKGVKDAAGTSLVRSTLAKIILDVAHPVSVGGKSQLAGIDDNSAAMLEHMRGQLATVFPALPGGKTKADVVMAYTFKTQSITPTAIQLAQLPYAAAAPVGTVTAATFSTPAQAAADYGVPAALLPAAGVAEVDDVTFVTLDLLDPGNQGAFDPAHPTPKPITAVVAIPPAAAVTGACPAGIATAKCAPLVVFRHGITRSRGDMLFLAASLTSRGFVVAAIDLAKHGDRTYCSANDQCLPGDTCVPNAALGTPVDAVAPGTCQVGLLRHRMDCDTIPTCLTAPKGLPFASGNYLVSLNLFRTRDTLRQDIVDTTLLTLALARPVPLRGGAAPDAFASHLDAAGIAVDPTKVYLVGQSLGANEGVLSVATNPRFSRAVLAEGGATAIDVFANPASTAFHPDLVALLLTATPPIVENTPQYLQFLQIAKWVLDPADPANFAGTLAGDAGHPRLPIGLPFAPAGATDLLVQAALCDDHVPNPQNELLAGLVGFPPPDPATAGTGNFQWFMTGATGATCPANAATHGVLLDFASPTLTGAAQATVGDFLSTGAGQPTPVRP